MVNNYDITWLFQHRNEKNCDISGMSLHTRTSGTSLHKPVRRESLIKTHLRGFG